MHPCPAPRKKARSLFGQRVVSFLRSEAGKRPLVRIHNAVRVRGKLCRASRIQKIIASVPLKRPLSFNPTAALVLVVFSVAVPRNGGIKAVDGYRITDELIGAVRVKLYRLRSRYKINRLPLWGLRIKEIIKI